ncbi:MAG: hypothetical protein JXR75_07745 [Rhodobacteraceae bacterium]|nr:hypothetical protein [Paracoccaceae bacterium]
MARVVLHIGTHKTATTTIQDMFAHNAALLAEHGLIYPMLGPATGHHGLVMDWNPLPDIYALPGGATAALAQISAEYSSGDKTVFLSSEEFSRLNRGMKIDFVAVRKALAGFDQIEVVCVLREQWQFIQSIYLEIAKSHSPPSLSQVLEAVLGRDMAMGLSTDYNQLYDHLLTGFSPEEITFMDFDRSIRAPGGIVGAMLSHLGSDLPVEALSLVNGGVSNPSPKPLASWAASIVSEPIIAPPWLVTAVTGAFDTQFGPDSRSRIWTREECRALQDYAERCNSRLEDRLAPWQPGFAVTRSPLPTAENPGTDIFREDVPANFWLRCSRWTFAAVHRGAAS